MDANPAADGVARRPHLLVMDHAPEFLGLLRELFEDEGYRVTASTDPLAIEQVKRLRPDAIVQDLLSDGTPEQGWRFLTQARRDPDLARVPLVLCTTAVDLVRGEAAAEELRRLGVAVVAKPFDLEELLEMLAEQLGADGAAPEARA